MPRMTQIRLALMLASGISLASTGCTSSLLNTALLKPSNYKPSIMDGHGTEQRVVSLFTEALAEDNEAAFRRIVSTRFEQKALRAKDSYKDLEILSLPKTKLEVVESKELEPNKFEAVAKDEKTGTKYQFLVVRDAEKKRWVVDDVMLRQQKKGTRATKSSVEVMDLLLTIREFLDTWQSADRDVVLQVVSTELREPMEKLPEPWMQQMIARVSAEYENGMARRPEAQMNEADAVVKMPSKNGFLLLKVAREDDKWLVSDIEVRKRKSDDHPGSVLRQARAMNAVTQFLSAYNDSDQTRLEKLSEAKFYKNALSIGDLSLVPMPASDHAPDDFEIQSFAGQLTVMIPDESAVVRIDLTTPEVANAKDDRKRPVTTAIESEFIIADVTIYDRQTQQQRNLKSTFTAPSRALLFLSALQTKDLPMLKETSTSPLSEASWKRIDPALIGYLPLTGIPSGEMTLQSSHVRGEVTEMEFISSDGKICSVLMRDENGSLKVDDVEYPDSSARVASLRTQLMLSVPVIELATAWESGSLDSVKRASSMDFNRLVWSNLSELPEQFDNLPQMLRMPVQKTQTGEQRAMIELAESHRFTVTVTLQKENTVWVIDEIAMKQSDGTQLELRKTLRQEIAKQFLIDPSGGIQQAHFESGMRDDKSGVIHAGGPSSGKPRGNLTMPSSGKPTHETAARPAGIDMTQKVPGSSTIQGSQSDQTGTLRFGPATATNAKRMSQTAAATSLTLQPRSVAEAKEHDGVLYYHGDTNKSAQPTLNKTDTTVRHSAITDPSQHPIDIPLE